MKANREVKQLEVKKRNVYGVTADRYTTNDSKTLVVHGCNTQTGTAFGGKGADYAKT